MAAAGHLLFMHDKVLTRNLTGDAHLMTNAKLGANRMNRLKVIQFLVYFELMPAAILDFRKCTLEHNNVWAVMNGS